MSAADVLELGEDLADDDDDEDTPDRKEAESSELDGPAAARRIAGYLIVAGVLLAAGCIAFIVWEQYQANRAALEGTVVPFDGSARHPAPDPHAQDQPSGFSGPPDDEAAAAESD